jgi:protein subunit release factor A
MKNYVLEIQNSEGGDDSKLLVEDMYNIYTKVMQKNGFDYSLITRRPGFVSI